MSGSGGAGTGGSGTSGSGGSGVVDHPTDSSQTAIVMFLDAGSYAIAGMGFRPETMPSDGTAVPHLAVRRYFNETIIASKAAGNQPPSMGQHTAGSMAIKEILTGGSVVGKAAMLRTDTAWAYYCMSSEADRCFTGSTANTATYTSGSAGSCACHGSGTIVSHDVIP
jgi:hypothetical protein